jgi:hypothetical protein
MTTHAKYQLRQLIPMDTARQAVAVGLATGIGALPAGEVELDHAATVPPISPLRRSIRTVTSHSP